MQAAFLTSRIICSKIILLIEFSLYVLILTSQRNFTWENFTLFSVIQIFTLNPVAIPPVTSAGNSALSKLYIHYQSSWNAKLCHFQITTGASWTFALIFCVWISVCRWIEKSKIAAVAFELIDWNYYFASFIDIVSLSPRGRPLATNSAKALQRAADSLMFKLPPAATVQSSRPDPNKFVDFYSPAPALPARRTCPSCNSAASRAPARKRTVT